MSKHPIVHVEFSAQDREAAGEFYANLFGWQIQQMPEMNYATFDSGEGIGGGLNPVNENYPAGSVIVYIGTDDIPATLAKAEELGGQTIVPESVIPNTGWFALFKDPTGNMVGLYKGIPQS